MKSIIITAAVTSLAIISGACSSETGTTGGNAANAGNSGIKVESAPAAGINGNTEGGAPAGAGPQSPAGRAPDVAVKDVINLDKAVPKQKFVPLADGSEISTTMNKEGQVVETRVFANDPQISKAELTWVNDKQKVLRIYPKTGKPVQKQVAEIGNMRTVTVAELLAAAGVK